MFLELSELLRELRVLLVESKELYELYDLVGPPELLGVFEILELHEVLLLDLQYFPHLLPQFLSFGPHLNAQFVK